MTVSTSDAPPLAVPKGVRLLRIDGLWCTSCARAVEKTLRAAAGVEDAEVSFATRTAVVRGDVDIEGLKRAVRRAGYGAEPWTRTAGVPPMDPALLTDVAIRLATAVFFSMWVMMLQLVLYLGELAPSEARGVAVAASVLAAPVVFGAGGRIHLAGLRTLRAGAPGMDTLIALGSLAAYGLSLANLVTGSADVWFDTASMLVTLLLAGRLLEAKVRARGDAAIAEALGDVPEYARRLQGGTDIGVAAVEFARGDPFRIEAGDTVALDGIVTAGAATVDRAALTGESVPARVQPGARVFAGTRIVTGTIDAEVVAAVGQRRIDALRARVQASIGQRTELMATADAFVERLVPLVLVVAVVVAVLTAYATGDIAQGVLRAAAVIVVTCPCALGLAAPLALTIAVGVAARRGVLFRTFDALERAATVDTVVFDKTGTLTLGRVVLGPPHRVDGDEDEALATAASAEWGVEHPVAEALRAEADRRGLALDASGTRTVVAGRGVKWCARDGHTVRVGSAAWVLGSERGDAMVAVRRGDGLVAVWPFRDALRPDAEVAVDRLRAEGYEVRMWSGDAAGPVAAVADALRIEDRRANQSPEAKAEGLSALGGRRVAFVGDGTNDALALAEAHLGIASDGAAEAAVSVAPVNLRGGGVGAVTAALELARRTRSVIRQNLGWAVAYNLIALPVAAAGVVGPVGAAIAMLLSSLTVTLNALRLG